MNSFSNHGVILQADTASLMGLRQVGQTCLGVFTSYFQLIFNNKRHIRAFKDMPALRSEAIKNWNSYAIFRPLIHFTELSTK